MKTVTHSHPGSDDDAQSQARHGEDRTAQTRAEAYAALAVIFTRQGWTPETMREAELVFSPATPVADAMRAMEAGDTAAGDR
jgi:hypothetical protein